jgi:curved DNA-binding protein CbpA
MTARIALDPYEVLGVSRDASALQIARAHRRLAKRHHPDIHGADEADRMRRINEAWFVLSNSARRADYDRSHPSAGMAEVEARHWAASRSSIQPSAPSSTRTWATWRATAAETRSAPRTVRQPGEIPPMPRTRRPPRPEPPPTTFRDSGLAAVLVAALIVLLLTTAIALGRLSL